MTETNGLSEMEVDPPLQDGSATPEDSAAPVLDSAAPVLQNGVSSDGNNDADDFKSSSSSSKDKHHSSSKHHSSKDKHHSSSSSKDKHHSSSRDKHSSSSKHGSSSSSHKHGSSSSSSSKDKDKRSSSSSGKDKDKHSSSSSSKDKDKHHSSSSSKHLSSSSKDKDKHSSSSSSKDKDKHHSSSSSSKDKHRSSSSKDKHHSSSSSSKDKDKHSSSSSKHGSSSSSKHRSSSSKDKDKHHSSSSSSKHRDGHSSSKSKSEPKLENSDENHVEPTVAADNLDIKQDSMDSAEEFSVKQEPVSPVKQEDFSPRKEQPLSPTQVKKEESEDESSVKDEYKEEDETSVKEKNKEDDETSMKEENMEEDETSEKEDYKEEDETSEKEVYKEEDDTSEKEDYKEEDDTSEKEVYKEEDETSIKEEYQEEDESSEKEEMNHKEEAMDSDDDVPLSSRKIKTEEDSDYDPEPTVKKEDSDYEQETKPKKKKKKKTVEVKEEDDSDDEPLSSRMKKVKKPAKKRKADDSDQPVKKKAKKGLKLDPDSTAQKLKDAEEATKWKWWEETREDDGTKWNFLEHKGPVLAPPYEPLPDDVKFSYDGQHMKLSEATEEVATFYGRMLNHDYTTMDVFNKNFMKDWRSVMTKEEREVITDIKKCNFKAILQHFTDKSERRKAMTKEERNKIKEENAALQAEYGFCKIDGHMEKIGNFRIEPPGLFRGRGSHPKMGMLKKRTLPESVMINCSKDAKVPEPPAGHRWKEVRHDNKVTWLACWIENVQGQTKYVMLNPASKLKGEKDWQKYEVARELHKCVDKIRANYYDDFKSKEMRIRQRAVAMYFIDKLALRAGNEKDDDTADTVGCCSLRVEHLTLHEELDSLPFVVVFDFLGKDSIRYYNKVAVEKRVYKNLQLFMDNKAGEDDVFDRLNTAVLNKHLTSLMDGLTAKVFRTYNASKTLQEQLDLLTDPDDPMSAKLLSYNRANRKVAILCNHQRAAPKNFEKQMENLQVKIDQKKQQVKEAKKQVKEAKADYKGGKSDRNKMAYDKKKKALERIEMQLTKLEVSATDKDENKEIALGTSKLNYLDPRISVAWCKKWEAPLERIYNKTQRDKFAWAIDMADADFKF